jgi:hypothetical protein
LLSLTLALAAVEGADLMAAAALSEEVEMAVAGTGEVDGGNGEEEVTVSCCATEWLDACRFRKKVASVISKPTSIPCKKETEEDVTR